jgi:23S rRNA (adenine2503-C2)-methyltransferase
MNQGLTMHEPSAAFVPARSRHDDSVNFVRQAEVGRIEARYVRRAEDKLVVYLSSQTGCRQACRMCHLTATSQTRLRDVTLGEMLEQADCVLDHYRTQVSSGSAAAQTVHFNFMARGEPMLNPVLLHDSGTLFDALWQRADALGLRPRFLVSTILPVEHGERPLSDVFRRYHPELYYSLYSMAPEFRRRWLPKAQPAELALDRLAAWQRATSKIIKVHHAFIAGENDSERDVHTVCDALDARGLHAHINIVRYNPPSPAHGAEPPDEVLERNAALFRARLPKSRVKVIARVGFDVHASCGMFTPALAPLARTSPEHETQRRSAEGD